MALGLSIAGQLLLLERFFAGEPRLMPGMLVAAALAAWPRTSQLHRIACMVLALWFGFYRTFDTYPVLLALVLMALAVALWLLRRRWSVSPQAVYVAALAHAATFMGLALLAWSHAHPFMHPLFSPKDTIGWYRLYVWGAALVWLACAGWLTRDLAVRQRICLIGAALVLAVIGSSAPALLLCLALMLATFHACQRAWFALSLLCAWVFLGLFYYSLHQSLLLKSATLGAAGAALLALGWLARRWKKEGA